MNILRIIITTIILAIFSIFIGMITCGGVFNWVYHLEPTNVWKPMETVSYPLMNLTAFFESLIFVYFYALIDKGIPGQNKYAKGALYGLMIWAVGMLPGMISTYMFQTIAPTVVIYWTIWGLIVLPVKGLIVSAIYDKSN